MDLLEKFDSVEIKQDTRISEADRAFCEAHQAAYENAAANLQELEFFWNDMLEQQKTLLASIEGPHTVYLLSHDGLKISSDTIREQLRSLHTLFIGHLASYFTRTYHFSIDTDLLKENLLPAKPPDKWADNYKELAEKYIRELQELTLHYNDILEQVFLQTGGRAFSEQALSELKAGCRKAVWRTAEAKADYTLKKSTLQFTHYACSFRTYYRSSGSWDLSSGMKNVLKGLAHFETGSFTSVPDAMSGIMAGSYLNSSEYSFSGCRKIQALKMFKNGRVDIKFSTEEHARKFMDEYLGTVRPCEA